MDWCGRVGEVNEFMRSEWMVGYHWMVPKIFSMPDKVGASYYSPVFRFFDTTWYFGICCRNCKSVGKDWIGLEIWRSTNYLPKPFRFSLGIKHADQNEYLIHPNMSFPAKDNVCSINEFLSMSVLLESKDKIAPAGELTVICVIWPDVPPPEKFRSFKYAEVEKDSEHNEHANDGDCEQISSETEIEYGLDAAAEDERSITAECSSVSALSAGNDGIFREVSRGVEWEVVLPPTTTSSWDLLSPEFTCGEIKYHFNLCPDGIDPDLIRLRFIVNISSDGSFPLHIRWRMAVKAKDFTGLRWIMREKMTVHTEYHQHAQEICIKRAELERLLSSGMRLTFVHYLSIGEGDTDKDVSTQTEYEEFQQRFQSLLQPTEEEEHISSNQQNLEQLLSEIPIKRLPHHKKPFMFAA